jgi:two-component system NarL family sensor kinase
VYKHIITKKLTKASNIINCSRINLATKAHYEETDGITHHATVPLRSGQEQFGLLNVATPYTTSYSEEDLELLESVAFQIGSAIKRIWLTDQEKEAARINERNRLARDLHDSVNQMLFSVKLTAHAAKAMSKEEMSKNAFNTIEETSQQAVNEMRALIWQLKPIGLEQGLVNALKSYCEMMQLNLNVQVEGLINVPSLIEENVYRILQEAINNVKKHANTKEIELTLNQHDKYLYIEIADYGTGFNIQHKSHQVSHGLNNMRQRIKMINGKINIQSSNGQGTRITLTIPI